MKNKKKYKKIKKSVIQYNIKNIIDCTFGFGGHNKIFQKHCDNIINIDRDVNIKEFTDCHINIDLFSNFYKYIDNRFNIDCIFADLGLSNMQINSNRGFSFMKNSELSMGMGCGDKTCSNILNTYSFSKLYKIFQDGECNNPTILANNIIKYRLHSSFYSTNDLIKAINITKYNL